MLKGNGKNYTIFKLAEEILILNTKLYVSSRKTTICSIDITDSAQLVPSFGFVRGLRARLSFVFFC